jgi:hypothetical protein
VKERSRSAISLRFAHHDHQLLIFTTRITNDIQPHCLPYNGPPVVAAAMPPKPQPVASRPRKQQETRSPRELELIAALARRQYIRQITGRTPKQDFVPDQDELDDADADSASDPDDLEAYLTPMTAASTPTATSKPKKTTAPTRSNCKPNCSRGWREEAAKDRAMPVSRRSRSSPGIGLGMRRWGCAIAW